MSDPIPTYGHCAPRFRRVREILEQALTQGEEIGAAAAFVLDGETVVDLWGGYRDDARQTEWTRDTLVNVYSTTKGMVAICAHHLIERGLLDADAPVARYWPEFAAAGKQEVPVRWLLSHQAGLPAIRAPLPLDGLYDWTLICDALAAERPWWTPGDGHGYHAITFGFLVGELVRRISGDTIGAYFRRNIAAPLGADFYIGLPAGHDARTATVYGVHAGNRPAREPPPPAGPAAEPQTAVSAALAEFGRALRDPGSMQSAALLNPPQTPGAVNTRAWRAAEIPSVNGHGSAHALGRIYGALACGGRIDGIRVLERATLERAAQEQACGPDRLLCGLPMRFAMGFLLNHEFIRLGPGTRAFGHNGAGGSVGLADAEVRLGFGFVMNRMHAAAVSPTAAAMLKAFYAALAP